MSQPAPQMMLMPTQVSPSTLSTYDQIARTIYILGVDHELQEDHLQQFFSICGPVTQVRVCGDTSHPTKFAFVEFASTDAASTAQGLTGVTLGSSALRVFPSKTAIQAGPSASSLIPTAAMLDPTYKEKIARTIYVGSVGVNITEAHLLQLFSACGRVSKICLAGDTVHAARFAFIEFETPQDAANALRLNGTMLGDRPIRVNSSKTPIHAAPSNVMDVSTLLSMNAQQNAPQARTPTKQEPPIPKPPKKRSRSPSRSVSRSRSRSPDRRRRRREHSPSRSHPRDSTSRSRRRGRSPSSSPSKSRSRSPERRPHSSHRRGDADSSRSRHHSKSPDRRSSTGRTHSSRSSKREKSGENSDNKQNETDNSENQGEQDKIQKLNNNNNNTNSQ